VSALLRVALVFGVLTLLSGAMPPSPVRSAQLPCAAAQRAPDALRLPAIVPPGEPVAIEHRMLAYLQTYGYRHLGWCVDKSLRDTGPYLNHSMYGTHPVVRIYYSPEMIAWLERGRRGTPADGAVMIKEQYGTELPAAAFEGEDDGALRPTDWTVMIRRGSASHDGWFWAELFGGMFASGRQPSNVAHTRYPDAGFGLYCLRCHASAQSAGTFASLENVRGFPGEPLRYRVDDSWQWPTPIPSIERYIAADPTRAPVPLAVQTFPPETLDGYFPPAHGSRPFLTSSQCMACHGAASGLPFGPTMWVTPNPQSSHANAPGIDVSEYGEWRWSPMALAGRDPVFYAQVASELHYVQQLPDAGLRAHLEAPVTATCASCHGVMGRRAYSADHPDKPFSLGFIFEDNPAHEGFEYGAFARDGISCMVCHRSAEPRPSPGHDALADFLAHKINGGFDLMPPDRVAGPFKDDVIVTHAMKEALGIKPVFSHYITSSQMCASCHTINLPVIDNPGLKIGSAAALPIDRIGPEHNVEQATYLEWLNSRYQTERAPGGEARSCQDCHMPEGISDPDRGIALAHIASRIATIEDDTYPQTTDAASHADLHVRVRQTGYHRHTLLGLNAFLLETFKQFPDVLGVRTVDYMSNSKTSLDQAIENVVSQARASTARVKIRTQVLANELQADVEVQNLTGHRFPSGVAFRRAFIDFEVEETSASGAARHVFASGRTDERGRLIGVDGRPLPSESFARDALGRQQYQEHFDVAHPITREDQVEIFEELTTDHSGSITTSFLRRHHEIKDNRILPIGWRRAGAVPMPRYFLAATYPKGRATTDPAYLDGKGHALVRYLVPLPAGIDRDHLQVTATLYYQSWAPYYLAQRTAESGPASQRLRELVDHLDLSGSELAGWHLPIASASTQAQ